MTQSNIFMEEEDSVIYVNVLPDVQDTVTNAASSASASAASASASVTAASVLVDSIRNIKSGVEIFVSQALENLRDLYNNISTTISSLGETVVQNINSSYNSVSQRMQQAEAITLTNIRNLGSEYVNEARSYSQAAQEIVDFHVSTEHLNQSKGILTGDISDDSVMMANVKSYARSTFDASKFMVVGSPIVTDDGVLSNPSSSDYLAISGSSNWDFTKPWEIGFKVDFTKSDAYNICLSFNSNGSCGFRTSVTDTTKLYMQVWSYSSSTSGNNLWSGTLENYHKLDTGIEYDFKFTYDGVNKYTTYIKKATEENYTLYKEATSNTTFNASNDIKVGGGAGSNNGIYNLKNLYINIDGVPVFNGNKTGIDTIKPDDYTEVGSPTITADGVASGFSSGNYIKIPDFDRTKAFNIIMKFTTPPDNNSLYWFMGGLIASSQAGFVFGINTNGKLRFFLSSTGTGWDIVSGGSGTTTLSTSTQYYFRFQWTGSKYIVYTSTDKQSWTEEWSLTSSSALATSTDQYIGIGASNPDGSNNFSNGSIDLNAFKIYVDGDLVYQPCLKIPYTESKTGSKVVNAVYRDRVNDVYEQGYLQRYYTLDENNGNFTLPRGEIYGMIEQLRHQIEMLNSES